MTYYTDQERARVLNEGHMTHEQFRKVGMTGDAANYPYSEEAFLFLCEFNGCQPDKAPRQLFYAANPYMQKYTHDIAITPEKREFSLTVGKGIKRIP